MPRLVSRSLVSRVYIILYKLLNMSNKLQVTLAPLEPDDKEQFILDNQWAFKYGAMEEMTKQREQSQACLSFAESRRNSSEAQFGVRDEHFEEDGEIISHDTIEQSINNGKAYRILLDGGKSRRLGASHRRRPR